MSDKKTIEVLKNYLCSLGKSGDEQIIKILDDALTELGESRKGIDNRGKIIKDYQDAQMETNKILFDSGVHCGQLDRKLEKAKIGTLKTLTLLKRGCHAFALSTAEQTYKDLYEKAEKITIFKDKKDEEETKKEPHKTKDKSDTST